MRIIAMTAVAGLLASGSAAVAAPASVHVSISPELMQKAEERKGYGLREVERLAVDLRTEVEQSLASTGAYDGARIELTLVDVKPNRPTFKQMSDTPGLSMRSFGVGGARIEGRIISADGAVTPVGYGWYESDIRDAYGNWTWQDAEWTFDRFAARLGRGDAPLKR